jgi:hypothetical protein
MVDLSRLNKAILFKGAPDKPPEMRNDGRPFSDYQAYTRTTDPSKCPNCVSVLGQPGSTAPHLCLNPVRQDIMQDGTSARPLCLKCYVDWTRAIPKGLGGPVPWHQYCSKTLKEGATMRPRRSKSVTAELAEFLSRCRQAGLRGRQRHILKLEAGVARAGRYAHQGAFKRWDK